MLPPTLRSVAWAATLALTSGCSQGSGDQAELYPVVDERGILTYRYRHDAPPPAAAPTQAQAQVQVQVQAAATASRPSIEQQWIEEANLRRRRREEAYDDMLAELKVRREQARLEMQADEEYRQEREQVVREQIRREQSRRQEWNRRQAAQRLASQQAEQAAAREQQRRAAADLDDSLRRLQQSQSQSVQRPVYQLPP